MPDDASPIDNALSQIAREQQAFLDRRARDELPPDPDPELHSLFVDFVSRLDPTTARPFVIQGPRRWVQKRVKAGWLGLKSYTYEYEIHDNEEQARGWYTGFGHTFIASHGDRDRYPPTDDVPGWYGLGLDTEAEPWLLGGLGPSGSGEIYCGGVPKELRNQSMYLGRLKGASMRDAILRPLAIRIFGGSSWSPGQYHSELPQRLARSFAVTLRATPGARI